MFGKIIIYLLFFLSISTSVLYFYAHIKKGIGLRTARKLYNVLAGGIAFIALFFMSNILALNFQYTYIWENTSRELPNYLLISAFYAGQQGSFMLWVLFFALIGFMFKYFIKDNKYESVAMVSYVLIMSLILIMLIFKSPFDYVWETYNGQGIDAGFTPKNGRGLNPILENIWMVIHPPILFLGYTTISIPFVFALAALIRKDFRSWVEMAYPWVLASSAILGLGIMLGGFWAYETLGWGGFWGWDPVENSSLLPWLTSLALIHTMIVYKRTGALGRTNIFLAIISFILVLYATFLTRSGILGNASVHSFTDPGSTVYALLIAILGVATILSAYLFFRNFKNIRSSNLGKSIFTREFFLSFGSIIILLSALIVFFGTSWPLITDITGIKKSSVSTDFYNDVNLPLIILILITNAISLYLNWKQAAGKVIFRRSLIAIGVSIIATIVFSFLGFHIIKYSPLMLATFYSLLVNIEFALRNIKNQPFKIGGNLSHAGISLLMIGVLFSGNYSSIHNVQIKIGETKKVNNYTLKLIDKIQIEKELADRQKFIYRIKVSKGNESFYVDPKVYWSDFNSRSSAIIEPGIKNLLFEDVYITLKSSEVKGKMPMIELTKGTSMACPIDTNIIVEMQNFDMSHKMTEDVGKPLFGVVLLYKYKGNTYADTIYTSMRETSVYSDVIWYQIPGTGTDICFWSLLSDKENISNSKVVLAFKPSGEKYKEPEEVLALEVAFKPLINFVWIGVIAIVAGFIIPLFQRKKQPIISE